MTGIPPAVFEDDAELFDALEDAAIRNATRWTSSDEMLASILETLHALLRATVQLNGGRVTGAPLHVPRPHEEQAKPAALSPREFALTYQE